jgi:hypothetical protein
MRARVALDAERLALVEAIFVLGMKGGAAADHLENPRRLSSSSTSSAPVEEPMNTLTPAQPGARSAQANPERSRACRR